MKYLLIILISIFALPIIVKFIVAHFTLMICLALLSAIIVLVIKYKYPINFAQSSGNYFDSTDTDAINSENFMTISHPNRKRFFTGNFLRKDTEHSFGKTRKLNEIVPMYIEYSDKNNNKSKRKIEVFAFKTYEGSAYLYAFCHQKGESRTFYINSISKIVDAHQNAYEDINIYDYLLGHLVPKVDSEYNQKVVINCFSI
jgi:hypothetical protein